MEWGLKNIYQELILDHNRNPRNYYKMEAADKVLEGHNPLCGDYIKLYLKLGEGESIKEVSFQGKGCAISQASASLMTELVKGKSLEEAKRLFLAFQDLVTGQLEEAEAKEQLGKLSVFATINNYPSRVKCATLSWHTLNKGMEERSER